MISGTSMSQEIYDVVVIGSGGAGLSAALEAKKNGSKVLVVSKTFPTHSQTVQAQGGINAVLQEGEDSINTHIEDTYKASCELSKKENISFLCQNAKTSIEWLDSLGVPFSRDDEGKIAQRHFGGTKAKRTCYSSDYTGLKILHTLFDTALKEELEFLNEYMLLNIIVEEGLAKGVTLLDINTTEVVEVISKTVILATGGYSNIYNGFTTNSYATTGDGVASAIRAGAKLANMEFIQFHPTALKGSNILISESARAEGGYLVNSEGQRFVDELKPRDEVARAIDEQIKANKEVFLDLRHLGLEKIQETMPQERRIVYDFLNLKLEEDLIPVNPAVHYCMGGIKVNLQGQTNIKNLYACGECAEAKIHGANRLGGNSLLEIITLGREVGKNASTKSKDIVNTTSNSSQYQNDKAFINGVFHFPNKIDFYEKKEFMGKIFFKNVGIVRNDMHMKAVLSQLRQWQKEFAFMGLGDKSRVYNKNLVEFIEFGNMLELSEIVAVSAISRCESRGSHFRADHPFLVDGYKKSSLSYKIDGVLAVDFEDIK